ELRPGNIVIVPLGPRLVHGLVVEGVPGKIDAKRLREVQHCFDCPSLEPGLLRFINWLAEYTLSPPGMVARMVLRVPDAFEPEGAVEGIVHTGEAPERLTPARKRVLELASDGLAWT